MGGGERARGCLPAANAEAQCIPSQQDSHARPLATLPGPGPSPGPLLRYTLNIWDVGGQKTLRSYWRNYFEQTDGLVWVVDSADVRRLQDCAEV